MTYITTYPSSGVHGFNSTWQRCIRYENIFTSSRWRLQDIPRSPRPKCTVVVSHMTDTQPLPYDRDCPQASLLLRGWVQDSHHPVGGYLPCRRCVVRYIWSRVIRGPSVESMWRVGRVFPYKVYIDSNHCDSRI
jgi:hypothetical protein